MCHFITATRSGHDIDPQLRRVVENHRLLFVPIENPTVTKQLQPSEGYFRATGHYCDCGTGLGAGRRRPVKPPIEKQMAKFCKKGWGEAKIKRWLGA